MQLPPFLSPDAQIEIHSKPYRHAVIRDAFPISLAERLAQCHHSLIKNATHVGRLEDVGERLYSAVNYTPSMLDISTSSLSVLCSDELRRFISGLLAVQTNHCIMLNIHRHAPPSKDGHPHSDCAVVSFPRTGSFFNGMNVYQPDSGCTYSDDTRDSQPESVKAARSLACLYYFGMDDWQPGDGGETAMYAPDRTTILKKVPPEHNTLFCFDTSPVSGHAYVSRERMVLPTNACDVLARCC